MTPLIPVTPALKRLPTPDQKASILGMAPWRALSMPPRASAAAALTIVKAGAMAPPRVALKLVRVASKRLATFAVESEVRAKSPMASVDWARISAWAARVLCWGVRASFVVVTRPMARARFLRVASSRRMP